MRHHATEILVIDDDQIIAMLLQNLTGYPVYHLTSSEETLRKIGSFQPIACFVDIYLGSQDNGLDIIPTIRKTYPHIPIIVLSSSNERTVIADALASGADDFIRKPLTKEEVNARLQVRMHEHALRRNQNEVFVGDITIDTQQRTVTSTQGIRYISATEVNLFLCLIEAQGGPLSRDVLKKRCWGEIHVTDNALNRKICEIRKVIDELSGQLKIRTIYGAGFLLEGGHTTSQ